MSARRTPFFRCAASLFAGQFPASATPLESAVPKNTGGRGVPCGKARIRPGMRVLRNAARISRPGTFFVSRTVLRGRFCGARPMRPEWFCGTTKDLSSHPSAFSSVASQLSTVDCQLALSAQLPWNHTLAHSFALFCAHAKINSFLFKRLRTLCVKHGVGGPPLTASPDTAAAPAPIPVSLPSANESRVRAQIPSGTRQPPPQRLLPRPLFCSCLSHL